MARSLSPLMGRWVCFGCKRRSSTQAGQSAATKPFFVTTPIFYVNADPHLGHMYSMVLADVIKRWQLLRQRKALLLTGIDEHGLKVQKAAMAASTPTQQFCDRGADVFQNLAQSAGISVDYFSRTTDKTHKNAVQHAWLLLRERGYIYEDKHEGWYSISDETFFPSSQVETAVNPITGKPRQVSKETLNPVEWTSETNYKFRLSRFQKPLLQLYQKNPEWVAPLSRMNLVRSAVEQGLTDLSISRPAERVQWGIPVPDDASQNVYVWLDALMNYTVQAGYPWSPEDQSAGGWPADVHVIGKDILRFHCIYWPAFLLALDLPLPRKVLSHSHWTIGGQKMSKSIGNVVNPFLVVERYGVDSVRLFLILEGRIEDDANYNNSSLVRRYNDVRGKLGNFHTRVTRSKLWNVARALSVTRSDKRLQSILEHPDDAAFHIKLDRVRSDIEPLIDRLDTRTALYRILELIGESNSWFHQAEPWTMISKDGNRESLPRRLETIISLAAEALRICGILLQPYMPGKAKLLLDQLGVDESNRTWDQACVGTDETYGVSKVPIGIKHQHVLFPPVHEG